MHTITSTAVGVLLMTSTIQFEMRCVCAGGTEGKSAVQVLLKLIQATGGTSSWLDRLLSSAQLACSYSSIIVQH